MNVIHFHRLCAELSADLSPPGISAKGMFQYEVTGFPNALVSQEFGQNNQLPDSSLCSAT